MHTTYVCRECNHRLLILSVKRERESITSTCCELHNQPYVRHPIINKVFFKNISLLSYLRAPCTNILSVVSYIRGILLLFIYCLHKFLIAYKRSYTLPADCPSEGLPIQRNLVRGIVLSRVMGHLSVAAMTCLTSCFCEISSKVLATVADKK